MPAAPASLMNLRYRYSMITPGSRLGTANDLALTLMPFALIISRSNMSFSLTSTVEPSGLITRAAMSLIFVPFENGMSSLLYFSPTIGENLQPHIMLHRKVFIRAVVDSDFPKDRLGVGIRLDLGR